MLVLLEGILLVAYHTPVDHRLRKGREVAGNRGGKAPHNGLEAAGNLPPVAGEANDSAVLYHRSTRDGGFGHGSRTTGQLRGCILGEGVLGGHSYQTMGEGRVGVLANGIGHGPAVAYRVESKRHMGEQAAHARGHANNLRQRGTGRDFL